MKEFIIENWRWILEIVFAVIALIFCLIRKKPIGNQLDSILKNLYSLLPILVYDAEQTDLKGSSKKDYVISKCLDYLYKRIDLSPSEMANVKELLSNQIELILSTPRKKVI